MAKTTKSKGEFKVQKMNYKYQAKTKEWGESVVVPDETYTVREMLHRHANGINFDNVKTPFYEEQASFTTKSIAELQRMDITDKLQYLDQHKAEMEVLRAKIQEYRDEKLAEAQQNDVTTTNDDATKSKSEA